MRRDIRNHTDDDYYDLLGRVSLAKSSLEMLIRRENATLLLLQAARGRGFLALVARGDLRVQRLDGDVVVRMDEEGDGVTAAAVVFRHDDAVSQCWKLPVGPVRQELACVHEYGAW